MYSKTKLKTKIIATLVAVFMLFSNVGLALGNLLKRQNQNYVEAYSTKQSISNGDFSSPSISSGTTLPTNISNWTEIEKPESVTAGIITLDTDIATDTKIENDYKLSNLPKKYTGMTNNQVLMMNAGSSQANAGYKSEAVDFESGSYYIISFKAYTEVSASASAKLVGDDELEASENILRINTNAVWNEYKIYVRTNSTKSISANLELWLGSKGEYKSTGAVFFDNVEAYRYDKLSFETKLIAETKNYIHINLDNNYIDFINNADFEEELSNDNWRIIEESNLNAGNETINGRVNIKNFDKTSAHIDTDIKNTNMAEVKQDEFENDYVYANKYALFINNLKSGHVGYQGSYFTIEAKSLYKLSFLVNSSADATVKLLERNPYTNEYLSDGITANPNYYDNSSYEAQTFDMTNVSSSGYTNEFTNNWKEYSFYIKGNNLIDTEVNLELWLGTEDEEKAGYVFFDNFKLKKITTEEFEENSSNGTIANFNQNTTETDFANGTFNLVKIDEVNQNYPFAPESWELTKTNESANSKNGIVNTSANNTALGIPAIPAISNHYPNNNVLMIGNLSSNNQKYVSSSKTIDADTYAKITLKVLTTDLNLAKAGIRLVANSVVLGEILNIDTDGEWKTYTMLVKTGYKSVDVKLELSLGENREGTGYAFFDNVLYSTSLTEEEYNEDTTNKKVNLAEYDWTNAYQTETKGISNPYDWTGTNSSDANVIAGVIDTAKYGTAEGYDASNLQNPGHPEDANSNVLMIKSLNDAYYTYKTNLSSALTSGNYYKIQVQVLTDNLSHAQVEDEDERSFGASINIDGIEASFKGIDTAGEWKTYSIYINCTEDSDINIELSLGNQDDLTSGVAYFSTVAITKIDEDTYKDEVSILEDDATIDNIIAIGNTDAEKEDEGDDEEKDSSKNDGVNFNWLLVPSIITGLAILVAVVGAIWRNARKRAPKKAKIIKPYSKDNLKKLSNSHKAELKHINAQKVDLMKKQDKIAVELNKARNAGSQNVTSLEREYENIQNKLKEINGKKQEINKKHKQKIEELKKIEKVEKGKR